MKRIIYWVSDLEEWVDVAKNLEQSHDWKPVYWVAPENLREAVNHSFSDVTFHRNIDAVKGKPPESSSAEAYTFPVDETLVGDHIFTEKVAIRMMNRMDSGNVTGNHFTYNERERHYYKLLMYWANIIIRKRPDAVVFSSTPHMIAGYVLYSLCINDGVDTAIFTPTSLPNRFYLREYVHQGRKELPQTGSDRTISEQSRNHLAHLNDDYEVGEPELHQELRSENYSDKIRQIFDWPRYLKTVLTKLPELNSEYEKAYIKEGNKLIENSTTTKFQWWLYRSKAKLYRRQMRRYYDSLSTSGIEKPYIYFPLHFQPERTTSPEGGIYSNQFLAINLISESVPSDWNVYVKEHPSQFFDSLKGEQGRTKYFYDDLLELDNVELIDSSLNSFKLIDNSIAVATITGTAGWEAIVRGSPAIVFGNAWYQECSNCFPVSDANELVEALDAIQTGFTVDRDETLHFVSKIESISYRGYLDAASRSESVSYGENVRSLETALLEFIPN